MKEIIILGGGFAGVSAALHLQNKVKAQANITLIDKNSYHLFHASLYEVATSEEPNKNIAIPFSEIFSSGVKTIIGEIDSIDTQNHEVKLNNGMNYSYDYLIVAMGSEPAYFDIPGLENNSIPLKDLEDAVLIRNKIEEKYHEKVLEGNRLEVVVGGGGFSGTEFSAEMIKFREKLAKHHKRNIDLVGITVIQGSSCLLKELDEKVSKIAEKRLTKNGVKIVLNSHIKKVSKNLVETDSNESFSFDVLVWTGGIKANNILEKSGFKTNGRGQVTVNDKMLINGFSNIFAAGDLAEFADPITNKPAPNVAEVAIDQGIIASENVIRSIKGEESTAYKYKHLGYIVPLSGKFAVADIKKIRAVGFLGWIVQQIVFLSYLLKILSWPKALKRWNKFEMYLIKE